MKRLFIILLLILLTACTSEKASIPTSTPELLIKRTIPTPTPTRDWRESESALRLQRALDNLPTFTPTSLIDGDGRIPIYNANGDFLGFVGDATPTSAYSYSYSTGSQYSSTCRIKGNVTSRDKIYHCPNWRDYDRTVMNTSEGDRWFCSESEALAAGFRRPNNVSGLCSP